MLQRLQRTGKLNEYDDILNKQLESGFIENIGTPTISKIRLHYLPHFAVFKNDSRIVHDASAKANMESVCLNDMLEFVPSIIPDITAEFPIRQNWVSSRLRKKRFLKLN